MSLSTSFMKALVFQMTAVIVTTQIQGPAVQTAMAAPTGILNELEFAHTQAVNEYMAELQLWQS